jgi:peptide/nickel transport system substrate-binding protein
VVTRRDFLRRCALLVGATGAAGLLGACAVPGQPPAPAATAPPKTGGGAAPTAAPAPKAAATAAPAAPAPTAAAAPAAVKGAKTLTNAIFADPLGLDPHIVGNPEGRGTTKAIHDTLFGIDQNGRLVPQLVESWEQPDDKTFLLKLRQGVKFHDGTAFDAEAVKFNLDRVRNPDTKSIRAGEISTLDKVEVVNAGTVRLTLKQPFAAFLFPLADMAGCIGSPAAYQQWGADYAFHPSGTGPFKFVSYAKDQNTTLERNPDYWDKGKPGLDGLVLRPIPVDSSRLAELRSGGVQIAEALPFQDVQRLKSMPEIVVSEKVGFRWEYFAFNMRPEMPGANLKLRQAFQWAIDREALHQAVYFGTGAIAYDGILPGNPFFDPDYKPFTHDVERAKRLLGESGLNLPIALKVPLQPDPVKQRAAQIFQATAEPLGVKVEIEQVDVAKRRQQLQDGQIELDVEGWWGYRPDPDQYLFTLLHSTGSYAKYYGYSNPKMDELLMAERAATNEEQRRAIFRQISDLQNEDSPYVTWHYGSDFKGLSPKVKGFVHYQDSLIRYGDLTLE